MRRTIPCFGPTGYTSSAEGIASAAAGGVLEPERIGAVVSYESSQGGDVDQKEVMLIKRLSKRCANGLWYHQHWF